ncbi:pulmonary surfactant-associated protein A-like [Alligator sinensis]|uniref:Pulmonary surfactant-associated protein A-like n=1 Tax=Alligator sinensis TaxID=38654 RepID=A0A3Q0HKR6_ALLSI|nr:pulmonary surfactant-associated protein A-like [Alligator sinensis]
MMLSPQLFCMTTALTLLLVTCYAEKECIVSGKGTMATQGQQGLPLSPDIELQKMLQSLEDRILQLERVLILTKQITEYGGKLFATNGKSEDFETIFHTCKNAGGFIASPRNEGENNAILEFVKQFNTYAYMGIKEGLLPGEFLYLDNTKVSYTNWYSGEPSGRGTTTCVEMYTDGTWNDKKCNYDRLTVCEF